ncbi:MAG: ABC transporter ATP-binding protein [Mogibacterium sp.]|nr:ABC transporter ATP-binding protein [Mogibacterium sp.]
MSEVVIKANHLRKTFRHYKRNIQKMQHMLLLRRTGDIRNVFSDVSFEICKGEKVGIITKPGGGKTTMMRLLAGILTPEKGSVEVKGDITTLLDFRYGFDNSLTIRDNYEIRCTLLGWSRESMKEREEEILNFAGLSKAADQQLRSVKSTGANRLGFAISTYDKPDIMLFDEKLTFGGKSYTPKYMEHLKALLLDPEVTLVMAVNRLSTAANYCTRGIILNEGKVEFDGSYEEASAYYVENLGATAARRKKEAEAEAEISDDGSDDGDEYSDDGGGLD